MGVTGLPQDDERGGTVGRREFLKLGAGGLVAVTASSLLTACGVAPQGASGPASITLPMNAGWLFGGRYDLGFTLPDSAYTPVTVPHCVTPLSWWNWSYASWEHRWAYRRHFSLPTEFKGLRVFLHFTGVLTGTTPTINEHLLPQHLGGYLPFSYEITGQVKPGDNLLAVEDDGRWLYVPPEGSPGGPRAIDYLEPAGIYRDVYLQAVPQVFISDVFGRPADVLDASKRRVEVQCTVDAATVPSGTLTLLSELRTAGNRVVGRATAPVSVKATGQTTVSFTVGNLGDIALWSPESPTLYTLNTTLQLNGSALHSYQVRLGFREAKFEVDGFFLNGSRYKLFGLDRHQIFPWVGMAMPGRVQRHDAQILRQELNCNMVRCSHYPQSPYFLDACDELGLMVWEETPGWGFVGDTAWQALVARDVTDMIIRDRNRPSVIIWGTRVNEASNNFATLWAQTRQICYQLDGSRPSSGTMTRHSTAGWAEDVFAMDDYSHHGTNIGVDSVAFLLPPLRWVLFLVTEAVGAIDSPHYYERTAPQSWQQHQAVLHGEVHSDGALNNGYSGVIAWCGFDYDSDNGDQQYGVKWPGVCDTFRVPKPGAAIYQAQVSPDVHPVIQPSFYWDFNTTSPVTDLSTEAVIWSNCDRLEVYVGGTHYQTLLPQKTAFPGLAYPPFYLDVTRVTATGNPDLQVDGYVGSTKRLSRKFSSDHKLDYLQVTVDDTELVADGWDATRVVFRAMDRYAAPRPYPSGNVTVALEGPGVLVGEKDFPFSSNGGVGAIWVRSMTNKEGTVTVTCTHPTLGSGKVSIHMATPSTPVFLA
jgi:beta-galactosidase